MSKQLTLEQRYKIEALLNAGHRKNFIAGQIMVHKSTITQELKRNTGQRGYHALTAHRMAMERKEAALKHKKLNEPMIRLIREKIQQEWSPEEITGYCRTNNIPMISHEWIYQYVYADRKLNGTLYLHLRTSRPKRKKRSFRKNGRYGIPNRIFIDNRPEVVNQKARFGDWEVDTIVGPYNKGAILTMVERKSNFTVAVKTKGKKAAFISTEMINGLAPYKNFVHTITSDNGTEFALHQNIASKLQADFFFAHPYSSWERGLNEYINKLIRQYIPKKQSLNNFDQHYLNEITFKLNNRPRKKLGYKSPLQLFLPIFDQKVAFIT